MKRINFNIKDRKNLFLVLGLVMISVFSLTVVYAALNTVLTIQGNARVSAADWDIYLNNPRVTNGSATTDVPEIKTSSTLEFSTTLNMPGDFYEFTVDVVNGGSIDAMIENVVKTPELTTEQAKFLKYEITYQNGESISTKQILAKDTTMPIKVRIEYRRDISSSDLPTTATTLDLALTLEYVQSDGTGSSVTNNGVYVNPVSANGDINDIGTIVTIGTEQFYTIGTEGDNVKLLSMYNLHIGSKNIGFGDFDYNIISLENPKGIQDSTALGSNNNYPYIGVVQYATNSQKGTNLSDYNGSIIEGYVNNYKTILESDYGVDVVEARLINYDELTNPETFACSYPDHISGKCNNELYPWISSTTYWTGATRSTSSLYVVWYTGRFGVSETVDRYFYGVRPVIVISKDYF